MKSTEKIRKLKATAILPATTAMEKANLLRALSQIPYEEQPEVLTSGYTSDSQLGRPNLPVRSINIDRKVETLPGLEAARMLIKHLRDGSPLESRKIGYY